MVKACRLMAATLLLLTACGVPKTRVEVSQPAPVTAPTTESPGAAPDAAGLYRIDPAASEVRLLVYRAGAMARLGHNHVIVNHAVSGWVRGAADVDTVAFFLTMAVADFVIDDGRARAEEGSDFTEEVPPDAKTATRHNMLSPALLDGDVFPAVTLTSIAVSRDPDHWSARMKLRVAGHDSSVLVPFLLETVPGGVIASGIVSLRQTDMGLTPYSVMLGALQVQDQITVKFKLTAATNPP